MELRLFGQEWEDIPFAHKDFIGCTVDYVVGVTAIWGYLISLGANSFKGMKVGSPIVRTESSGHMAKSIFEALGAKCDVINVSQMVSISIMMSVFTHIEDCRSLW